MEGSRRRGVPMAMALGRAFVALSVPGAAACTALYPLSGFSGGAVGAEAGVEAGAESEAGVLPSSDGGEAGAPPVDLPSGLLSYYAFGDEHDSSGNGKEGRVLGGAKVDAAGVRGSGLVCGGQPPDAFRIGGDFKPGRESFTVAFFYALAQTWWSGPNGGINAFFEKGCQFENGNCGDPGFGIGISNDEKHVSAVIYDGMRLPTFVAGTFDEEPKLSDSSFHHLALVVDRSSSPRTVTLYFDGAELKDEDLPDGLGSLDSAHPGTLCTETDDPNRTFDGRIDEFMIFGRALQPAEIIGLAHRH